MDSISGISANAQRPMASSSSVMTEANQAINKWNLKELGWRGFEKLDWVTDITNKYPEAVNIAHTCSSLKPGFLDQVADMCEGMPKKDLKEIHKYYIGKLGLEELSCRMSGPTAGLCDKKGAYIQICQMTKELAKG